MVYSISYGSTTISCIGDATKKVQKFIAAGVASTSDILSQNIIIFSQNITPANISDELLAVIQPEYVVYSGAVAHPNARSAKTGKASQTPKKPVQKKPVAKKQPIDPFAVILEDDRFNLKEVGTVKITSDANLLKVITAQDRGS